MRKKANKKPAADAHLRRVTNIIANKIMIAGGATMIDVDVIGLEAIRLHARNDRERLKLTDQVNVLIRKAKRDWQFFQAIFSIVDGMEDYSYEIIALSNCNAVELDRITNPMLKDLVDRLDGDEAISYGWAAFPSMTVDVEAMVPQLVEYFKARGAYDMDRRLEVGIAKRLEGLESKRLVEEYHEVKSQINDAYPLVVGVELNGRVCEFEQTHSLKESGFTVMLKDPSACIRYAPRGGSSDLTFRRWVTGSIDSASKIRASKALEAFFSQFRINSLHIDAFTLNIGD